MSSQNTTSAKIFLANTQFEKLAKRPGGVSREDAIKSAFSNIDRLKADAIFWIRQGVVRLDQAIQDTWISADDAARFDFAITLSASLRDVGATVGFPLLTFVCNNLCEILETQKSGVKLRKDIIDVHRMALMLSAQDKYRKSNLDDLPIFKSGFEKILTIFRRESGTTGLES